METVNKKNKGKKTGLIAVISLVVGTAVFALLKVMAEWRTDYITVSRRDENGDEKYVEMAKRGLWHRVAELLRKF
ncbi:MAG: hypothetical protein LUI39_02555 [Lachnospiraceae bacterium]|nr:hypothetical protein [Lachnospiraceae bacterium]